MLFASFPNIVSHSVCCLFILFMVSLALQKLVGLIRSHLFFYFYCLGRLTKKTLVLFMSENVLPMLSSKEFYGPIFKLLGHFEFIFMHGVMLCSTFSDLHAAVQLSQHHLLNR